MLTSNSLFIDTLGWANLFDRTDPLHEVFARSLVDASSFVVMSRLGISEALTTDQHFSQAGFVRVPRP